jgi:hypothetical protein
MRYGLNMWRRMLASSMDATSVAGLVRRALLGRCRTTPSAILHVIGGTSSHSSYPGVELQQCNILSAPQVP